MNEIERRKGIKKYFQPFPSWGVWAIVIGLGLLFLGAQGSGGTAALGFLVAAVGGLGVWTYLKVRPTDQEFDQWRADDFGLLDDKALAKLGMDRDDLVRDAVAIWGSRSGNPDGGVQEGQGRRSEIQPSEVLPDPLRGTSAHDLRGHPGSDDGECAAGGN